MAGHAAATQDVAAAVTIIADMRGSPGNHAGESSSGIERNCKAAAQFK
jgi:hypothetical protein